MKKIVGIIIILIFVLAGILFLNRNETEDFSPSEILVSEENDMVETFQEQEEVLESPEADSETGEIKEFVVGGGDFFFTEEEIKVNLGDTVRIVFNNEGNMPHDLVLDEFEGARTSIINRGEQEIIEFVADRAGEFEYYCSVGSHRAQGMFGVLIVE